MLSVFSSSSNTSAALTFRLQLLEERLIVLMFVTVFFCPGGLIAFRGTIIAEDYFFHSFVLNGCALLSS